MNDPILLEYIRQIPGVVGIVSALHEVSVGDAWPRGVLRRLQEKIETAGLSLAVVERASPCTRTSSWAALPASA